MTILQHHLFQKLKNTITLLICASLLYSCDSDNKLQKIIEDRIEYENMHSIVNPKVLDLTYIDTVYAKDLVDEWCNLKIEKNQQLDSTFRLERIKFLKTKKPDEIIYYVLKANYKIRYINTATNEPEELNLIGFYLISADNKVLASCDEDSNNYIEKRYKRSKYEKYEFLIETEEIGFD